MLCEAAAQDKAVASRRFAGDDAIAPDDDAVDEAATTEAGQIDGNWGERTPTPQSPRSACSEVPHPQATELVEEASVAADVAAAAWADAAVAVPPALTDWGMVGYSINGAIESRRPVHDAACGAAQLEDARAAHCELNVTGPSPSDGGAVAAGATGGTEPTEPRTGTTGTGTTEPGLNASQSTTELGIRRS